MFECIANMYTYNSGNPPSEENDENMEMEQQNSCRGTFIEKYTYVLAGKKENGKREESRLKL